MDRGWVKLHRKLRDNPIYTNSTAVHCWVECLLRASHSGKRVYLKREKIDLKPGMFVMGREEFGAKIGASGSTAWYWMMQFESDSMVDIRKTAKGSIVTIRNWIDYQEVDIRVDSKKTTDEQQKNTNKNVKNDKNVKKREENWPTTAGKYSHTGSITERELEDIAYRTGKPRHVVDQVWDKLKLHIQAEGRQYQNVRAALELWVKREKDNEKNKPVKIPTIDAIR